MSFSIESIHDEAIWEDFILTHSPQSLFQSYWWGEVIKNSKIWRLGLFDNGKLVGIAQVEKVTAKRGTFLHLRHGPILSKFTKENFREVLVYLKNLAQQEGAWFIRVSPLIEDSEIHRNLVGSFGFKPSPIHAMDGELCWVLDIDKSEEELLSGMRKTTRYLIKQALKQSVKVDRSDDIEKFLELYEETALRQGFVPHSQIKEEFEVFKKANKALLLLGFAEKELISGALIVLYGNQAIYRHGASLPSKVPVSYLIQWEAIKYAKSQGFTLYNFWGIAPEAKPDHPWSGITLFKKGFGGREIHYMHAYDLPLSPLYRLSHVIESVRRICKGY